MEDLLIMKEQTGSVVVTLETACYLDKKKKKNFKEPFIVLSIRAAW